MSQTKIRHPFLTSWLLLMMFCSSLGAGLHVMGIITGMNETPEGIPAWMNQTLVGLALLNIICIFALFRWKKWGFYGLCIATSATLIIKVFMGVPIISTLGILLGIAILYNIFQIGKDDKGWPQLD